MPLGRSLLLALLVGAAVNPRAALPPEPLRLPAAIGVPVKRRTLADAVRTARVGDIPVSPTCKAGRKLLRAAVREGQKMRRLMAQRRTTSTDLGSTRDGSATA